MLLTPNLYIINSCYFAFLEKNFCFLVKLTKYMYMVIYINDCLKGLGPYQKPFFVQCKLPIYLSNPLRKTVC